MQPSCERATENMKRDIIINIVREILLLNLDEQGNNVPQLRFILRRIYNTISGYSLIARPSKIRVRYMERYSPEWEEEVL